MTCDYETPTVVNINNWLLEKSYQTQTLNLTLDIKLSLFNLWFDNGQLTVSFECFDCMYSFRSTRGTEVRVAGRARIDCALAAAARRAPAHADPLICSQLVARRRRRPPSSCEPLPLVRDTNFNSQTNPIYIHEFMSTIKHATKDLNRTRLSIA